MRKSRVYPTPRPILKWAGGKASSEPHILAALPVQIGTYCEPFFGGGDILFALARAGRFERAVISDSNEELIDTMLTVARDPNGVIGEIDAFNPKRISEKKYNRIRALRPRSAARRAARMIFLNKNCYNGLYRVNKAGRFNVPWNGQTVWVPDYANIRAVSELLRKPNIEIACCDFGQTLKQLELFSGSGARTAVYFDPPYLAESKTARFAAYTSRGFTLADHKRLGALFAELASAGVHVVASNAAVRGAEKIYESIPGTAIYGVDVARAINSKGNRRGKVGELLIVNPGIVSGESRNDGN